MLYLVLVVVCIKIEIEWSEEKRRWSKKKRDKSTTHSLEEALGPWFTVVRSAYEYISNHSSGPCSFGPLVSEGREE